jgi:hypothetical protein
MFVCACVHAYLGHVCRAYVNVFTFLKNGENINDVYVHVCHLPVCMYVCM